MSRSSKLQFEKRFRRRVLLPGALVLLVTAILCGGAIAIAGRSTDTAQHGEVWRARARGMDELSLAQESVGLCEQCIAEAGSADPDEAWISENMPANELAGSMSGRRRHEAA